MTLPCIIGQAPARGSHQADEHGTIIPFQGYSGNRLRRLAGVERLEDHFLVWNLIPHHIDNWDPLAAKARAARDMTRLLRLQPPMVLLMGRKVEQAFGFHAGQFLRPRRYRGIQFVVFPHPSGLSHWWNDRHNREAAKELLHDLVRAYGES